MDMRLVRLSGREHTYLVLISCTHTSSHLLAEWTTYYPMQRTIPHSMFNTDKFYGRLTLSAAIALHSLLVKHCLTTFLQHSTQHSHSSHMWSIALHGCITRHEHLGWAPVAGWCWVAAEGGSVRDFGFAYLWKGAFTFLLERTLSCDHWMVSILFDYVFND